MSTVIDLGALNSDGFTIQGDAAGDLAGYSVASAGDIDGDGFDEIIVGARSNDDGGSNAGKAYVIFGTAGGLDDIDLTNLASADGFTIQGDAAADFAGISVSGAGDINGDGFDDMIVGASKTYSFYYGTQPAAYVIFGSENAGSIDLTSLEPSEGFIINASTVYAYPSISVADAGDINGDGFDDIIIGTEYENNAAGGAYVIFGKEDGFGTIDLANLASSAGFAITGDTSGDRAGHSVSAAGDVNGDGFGDIIVGAYLGNDGGSDAGQAYVIFGKESGFDTVALGSLTSAEGFVIQGDRRDDWAGLSVSSAGDLNGDGFGDLIVGAPLGDNGGNNAGEAYVIFGKENGFGKIDLTNLSPDAGLIIQGDDADDFAGFSVSSAGDVNGDGFDDLIIGAPFSDDGGNAAGDAYVIFGRPGLGNINLTNLFPADGFIVRGDSGGDTAGVSVSGAGDMNGDGFADLVVGAPYNDDGGDEAGKAYVIFGARTSVTRIGSDSGEMLTGASSDDFIDGRGGNDSLFGLAGEDRLIGGSGNDTLDGGTGGDIMEGGTGHDTYHVGNTFDQVIERAVSGSDTVLSSISYVLGANVEKLQLTGSASIKGTGNGLNNVLIGNSGANVLDGGAGGDVMQGGAGNDSYYVGNKFDQVVEAASAGNDTVLSTISYVLGANLDNLRLLGSASINATGNTRDNLLVGNSGANILDGRAGADRMGGGLGNDTYHVDNAGDQVVENASSGSDTVFSTISYVLGDNVETLRLLGSASINATGNGLNNVLAGNSGANTLDGGAGNDKLVGAKGADHLWGGTGADEFAFGSADFGGLTEGTAERIHDFSQADGDRINLSQADANSLVAGRQDFTFIGSDAFHNVAGELRYEQLSGNTYVTGDTDGDGVADFLILLDGTHALTGGDFIL